MRTTRLLPFHQSAFLGGVSLVCNAVVLFYVGAAILFWVGFAGHAFGIGQPTPRPVAAVAPSHAPTVNNGWLESNERHNQYRREKQSRLREADERMALAAARRQVQPAFDLDIYPNGHAGVR
jgi:hypothetical protein